MECAILGEQGKDLLVLFHDSLVVVPRDRVKTIARSPTPDDAASGPIANLRDVLMHLVRAFPEVRQIPATVIETGIMAMVPYKSFRPAPGIEINVYGDPEQPVAVEIGQDQDIGENAAARQRALDFLKAVLKDKEPRDALATLPKKEGRVVVKGLTLEVTPATAPDAYGKSWISVYDQARLEVSRAKKEHAQRIIVSPQERKAPPAPVQSRVVTPDPDEEADELRARSVAPREPASRGKSTSTYHEGYRASGGGYGGPHCKKGCRCGMACIPCSHTCRH